MIRHDIYYNNFSKFALHSEPKFSIFANNAGHEVVGVRGFAGDISEAQWRESRKSNEYSYSQWSSSSQTIREVPLKILKHTLKINGKPVSGNKPDLICRLENYFLQIKMATRIQKTFRGFLVRKSEQARGCADPKDCNNNTDFYTLEDVTEIPHELFFSYRDENGFAYGFNILSLMSMFRLNRKLVNPYNREDIPFFVLQRLFSVYKKSRILYPTRF